MYQDVGAGGRDRCQWTLPLQKADAHSLQIVADLPSHCCTEYDSAPLQLSYDGALVTLASDLSLENEVTG